MIAEKYNGYYNIVFSQKEFITDYECPDTRVIYGKQGMCHALSLKWLAVQGTNLEKEIFTDLVKKNSGEIPEGREEIFSFSISYNAAGRFYENLNADASYPKKMTFISSKEEASRIVKNMTLEEQKDFRANAIRFVNELTINTEKMALEYMQMYCSEHLMIKKLNANQLLPEHTGKYEIILSSLKKDGHHGVAIYIDESGSVFKFFDPNHGEFLFSTADAMKAALMKLINHGKSSDRSYRIEYGYQFIQK